MLGLREFFKGAGDGRLWGLKKTEEVALDQFPEWYYGQKDLGGFASYVCDQWIWFQPGISGEEGCKDIPDEYFEGV